MDSGSFVSVSFETALVVLKREVLLVDVHTLTGWLGEFVVLKRDFRVDGNLRLEQEADVMYNVCKKELVKRGCFVEEFGDVG